FTDRPERRLADSGLSIAAIEAARAARIRLGSDLQYLDDELPPFADLPDATAIARLHAGLRHASGSPSDAEPWRRNAPRAVVVLGAAGATELAGNLDQLAAAHRDLAERAWLRPLSPLGPGGAESDLVVDFARDAAALLPRRATFVARPVEMSEGSH